MSDLISRADAIERIANDNVVGGMKRINEYRDSTEHNDYLDGISTAIATVDDLPSAEPIERISDNTIVVKYADYEDIGRIILTNGDIFCKMFYEDARQNDDSDYDSLVPDEYKTEPSDLMSHEEAWNTIESDLISRADAINAVRKMFDISNAEANRLARIQHADMWKDDILRNWSESYGYQKAMEVIEALPSADAVDVNEVTIHYKPYPSADAEQTDKLENQPCLVERNYTTEGGGGEIYHPNRQQGKWLPIEETLPTYDGGEKTWLTGMKCSNCGKLFDLRVGYYFCPSCGARMKGGAE